MPFLICLGSIIFTDYCSINPKWVKNHLTPYQQAVHQLGLSGFLFVNSVNKASPTYYSKAHKRFDPGLNTWMQFSFIKMFLTVPAFGENCVSFFSFLNVSVTDSERFPGRDKSSYISNPLNPTWPHLTHRLALSPQVPVNPTGWKSHASLQIPLLSFTCWNQNTLEMFSRKASFLLFSLTQLHIILTLTIW